jgi:hypothetical protein
MWIPALGFEHGVLCIAGCLQEPLLPIRASSSSAADDLPKVVHWRSSVIYMTNDDAALPQTTTYVVVMTYSFRRLHH